MSDQPLVTAIVPFRNSRDTMERAFRALAASRYPNLEILLIDDVSTDGSGEIAARYPWRLLHMSRQGGCGGARNVAVREAKGEFLFFTDADVIIFPDTISRMVGHLVENPDVDAAIGSYTRSSGPRNFFSVYKNLLHHFTHQVAGSRGQTFWGACGILRRDAFYRVGEFTEEQLFVTDIDFGYRLVMSGGRILIDPTVQVIHLKHYTFRGLVRSDVMGRAIPWTRTILRRRFFQRHMNLSSGNLLSGVACILGVPLVLLLAARGAVEGLALVAAGAVFVFALANRRFLRLASEEGGPWLMLRVAAMHVFFYIYSGVGLAMGVVAYMLERWRARGGTGPLASSSESGGGV